MKVLALVFTIFAALAKADEAFDNNYELFTANVFKNVALKSTDPNLVVSPLSANIILGLTQAGSRGDSQTEFWQTLNLPHDEKQIEADYQAFIPSTRGNADFTLTTANKLYIARDIKIREEFQKIATDVFSASAESVDFTRTADAVQIIDQWVAQQTNNKITDLLTTSDISALTTLVLVNTVHFVANFSSHFKSNITKKLDFHVKSAQTIQVDTLQDLENRIYNYGEDTNLNVKYLQVPLQGDQASIIFILPNEIDGLLAVEKQADKINPNLVAQRVTVRIPKFKIETRVNLKNVLSDLGLKKPFVRGEADLSGIAGGPGDLYIENIIQKNYISVNENGVEAASATAVDVDPTSVPPPANATFFADHPFLFYIEVRGHTIFGGRVSDPSK